mmetsp:Transcript_49491/g.123045  ORF Transcript_49491/g.123045 Transcript_49491/m.123045 type:complete len:729 (+) Transcript_49491:264-2450(+)
MLGEIDRWVNKVAGRAVVIWPADATNTIEYLSNLFVPSLQMKLEPFEDGRSAPKAKGATAKRLYALAVRDLNIEAVGREEQKLSVAYTEGSQALVQVWDVHGPQFVREDWRRGERFRMKPAKLSAAATNTVEKCLLSLALPMAFADDCTKWFNQRLPGGSSENEKSPWKAKTTKGEILRFWGYMGAIALCPGESVEAMWRSVRQPGDIFPPPALGVHGLTKNRFEKLRHLQGMMFDVDETGLDPTDSYRYCRAPVEAFNYHRRNSIIPSWLLVCDESMSAWTGTEGVLDGVNASPKPIPLLHFIERKPEPLGCELKVLADGCSGCFLALEIQEGAERHVRQKWYDEYGHSAAVQLRLLQPYFKTATGANSSMPSRVYGGDSWFMSVNAAEAIHHESGKVIFPFGDVKTNTSRFPKDDLAALCGPDSGDWATITTRLHLADDTYLDMMGVAHRRGPEVHTFLATAGETTVGQPQRHKDDDLDADTGYIIARKCPKVLNDWTAAQPKIDRHNRLRQRELAMEKRFVTESFPFRLFTTVLGMVFVDAYYLYLYLNNITVTQMPFKAAMRKMAIALMYNNFDAIDKGEKDSTDLFTIPSPATKPAARAGNKVGEEDGDEVVEASAHQLIPLRQIEGYTGSRQQWCSVCGTSKVSYACAYCSSASFVLAIHPLKKGAADDSGHTCLYEHRRDPGLHRAAPVRSKVGETSGSTHDSDEPRQGRHMRRTGDDDFN